MILFNWLNKNVCKDCYFYRQANNVCVSKKCSTCGTHLYSNWFDKHFCKPHKCLGGKNIYICRECGKMRTTGKTVTLTPFEIKMMQMSLYHQWFRMTDDNGKAVNCEQKSADCVYDLLNRFEKLRAEVEKENEE